MADSDRHPFVAASVTPELINRERELVALQKAVAGTGAPVFYLTGRGGNGKTFLLRHFLRRTRETERAQQDLPVAHDLVEQNLLVAHDLVDLYHTENHTADGLCQAILQVLKPTVAYFEEYREQRETYERSLPDMSMSREAGRRREGMTQAFLEDLPELTRDYRLVLAFDTAELLLYEADPIQEVLQIAQPGIEARDWFLKKFLPGLEKSVVIIAGRPEPPQLLEDLREALGERLVERSLEPLEEEDTLDYFDAVVKGARERGAVDVAERVAEIPEDVRKVIHRYVGGRPILLSLVLDYLVVTDRLLPALRRPLAEVERLPDEDLAQTQKDLEGEIVRSIQETGRRADDTVRKLAWARRGLDAPMLAWLTGLREAESQGRLDEVLGLSFVKVRPDDNRVFLQDEMYDLLQRHLQRNAPEQRVTEYSGLVAYYNQELADARRGLTRLQEQPRPNAEELGRARLRLQNAIAERVHYQLRLDAKGGLEAYYKAAEEAFQARHEGMDLQLREELLTFLYKHASGTERSQIEDWVAWDSGVRWVKRHIVRSDYWRAIEIAEQLRAQETALMERLGTLAEAELNCWEANARTYAGKGLQRAEELLQTSVKMLREFEPADEFDAWRCTFLSAHAFNNWGYLFRVRGAYNAAAERYTQALPLWRALKKGADADHANTLNNLAFALAETGEFDQALRYCRDGLAMREDLGPRYPVALSLNTMAMIHIRHDQPDRAVKVAERALGVFQKLGSQRGAGMAYRALAEALRREAEIRDLYSSHEQLEMLKDAEEYTKEAVEVFSDRVREQARLVESLIERGCVFRNWARLVTSPAGAEEAQEEGLARDARNALELAIKEAGDAFPHLKMDAYMNLAWHLFYMGHPQKARFVVEEEVYPLAEEYRIVEGQGVPELETPVTFFWVQLGKAGNLLGQIEMAEFQRLHRERQGDWQERADQHLGEAARHYTLAVAYDQLFGRDFREMRSGLDLIYDELKRLNARELGVVYEMVKHTQDEYCLRTPCRMLTFLDKSFGSLESLGEVVGDLERPSVSQ